MGTELGQFGRSGSRHVEVFGGGDHSVDESDAMRVVGGDASASERHLSGRSGTRSP